MSQSQQQTQIVNITTLSPEALAQLVKMLIEEFGYSRQGADRITDHMYQQSQSANKILSSELLDSSARSKRSEYTIEYFPKDCDHNPEIVCSTLSDLGFNVQVEEFNPDVKDVPTNAIWFGPEVPISEVKLVAYTLIRAGVDIKTIKPFRPSADSDAKATLIQIGADADFVESPSLEVLFIDQHQRFDRND